MSDKQIFEKTPIKESVINKIISLLKKYGASALCLAETLPTKIGITLRITDVSNKVFFVFLGGHGYIEIIRKDSIDGTIIYMAMDD